MFEESHRNLNFPDLNYEGSTFFKILQNSSEAAKLAYQTVALEGSKLYNKIRDILLPYNSFFGISNDLRCYSNKKDHLKFSDLM